jgi:hypothetical protein
MLYGSPKKLGHLFFVTSLGDKKFGNNIFQAFFRIFFIIAQKFPIVQWIMVQFALLI